MVGSAPGAITLALNQDEEGIWLAGCDRVDGAVAGDAGLPAGPLHRVPEERRDLGGPAHDKEITVAPSPAKDQALPASLHAFARGPEKAPPPQ